MSEKDDGGPDEIRERVARAIRRARENKAIRLPRATDPDQLDYEIADAALSASGYREREAENERLKAALRRCISFRNWELAEGGIVPPELQGTWRDAEAALSPKEGA